MGIHGWMRWALSLLLAALCGLAATSTEEASASVHSLEGGRFISHADRPAWLALAQLLEGGKTWKSSLGRLSLTAGVGSGNGSGKRKGNVALMRARESAAKKHLQMSKHATLLASRAEVSSKMEAQFLASSTKTPSNIKKLSAARKKKTLASKNVSEKRAKQKAAEASEFKAAARLSVSLQALDQQRIQKMKRLRTKAHALAKTVNRLAMTNKALTALRERKLELSEINSKSRRKALDRNVTQTARVVKEDKILGTKGLLAGSHIEAATKSRHARNMRAATEARSKELVAKKHEAEVERLKTVHDKERLTKVEARMQRSKGSFKGKQRHTASTRSTVAKLVSKAHATGKSKDAKAAAAVLASKVHH